MGQKLIRLLLIAILLSARAIPARAQEGPGRWLVKASPEQAAASGIPCVPLRLPGWLLCYASESELSAAGLPHEPDAEVRAAYPNDPGFLGFLDTRRGPKTQWWAAKILLTEVWAQQRGAGIKVAVLDTGIAKGHEDLPAPVAEYDFVNGDSDADDDHGHGTHVAGIIAATIDNGKGIAGGAAEAALIVGKVLNAQASGTYANVASGIAWAADQGAHVINLSLGGSSDSQALRDAIAYARSHGAVTVCAAGNSGSTAPFYPAYYCDLAVAAVDAQDRKAYWSNYGSWVDVAAPGVDILSTMAYSGTLLSSGYYPGYEVMDGTSMAAPMVAAVVALARAAGRCGGPDSCAALITGTSDSIPGTGTYWSGGRVNAAGALLSQPQPTPTPYATRTPTPTPNWIPLPTPTPTATPTPFVPPGREPLPPFYITPSLPIITTPVYDPEGFRVVGLSEGFLEGKGVVDDVLGRVVWALNTANSSIDDILRFIGIGPLGAEMTELISGTLQMQGTELRGQSLEELHGTGMEAAQRQIEALSSFAEARPTLVESARGLGITAAQPIAYARGLAILAATSDNPAWRFISAIVGVTMLALVWALAVVAIRYVLIPIALTLWALIRDIWEAIPWVG
ncbi:MAG: S8 family serine peptidase [Thermoflexus sp.]|nr:S8 family serine peptidase [Thermoflexus sp.]MDT7947159.1 S8 family serine peptidase [Thermoflexus sp.]